MEVARILPEMPIWVVTRIPAMAAKVPDAKNVYVHFSLDRHSMDRRDKALELRPLNRRLNQGVRPLLHRADTKYRGSAVVGNGFKE